MRKFSAVITEIGAQKLAGAALTGNPVGFTAMAVGDGGGTLPTPNPDSSGLINERYRAKLNKVVIADQAANVIEAEMIMPPQAGGYWLREMALFDADGNCLAIGNMPETYKPLLAEGSGRHQVIQMWLAVSSTADVELIDNPAVILATMEEVKRAEDAAKDYTDTIADEIEEATKKAIAAAVKDAIQDAWELDNPVGTSRMFNQNVNPNEKWPWSTWEYAGEHLTIRTAKADGSDVGTIGGSDTTNITRANLPAEEITVSGTAQDTDLGTKRTTLSGKHVHHGVPKRNSDYELGGNNRVFFDPYQEGDTDEAGEHDHEMELGPHGHLVSGKTDALGQGQEISVVERHKLQMLWHRVA
ncbi:phage tail protein [Serratia marcescens]|uniref:phage tail protein n=1 Tax=Serratia marcescens TaxID=615 RepID=UPI001154B225|nr:phage tail protein [Serratia marcescens]MDU3889195.1 phage tail protein [Serratia liquefaciens]MDU3934592.1 phage tail protein [Serratia liquefaciens]QDI42569.1 phage tail protein [Serratia marcescens]QDI56998.1 phage tail protein [Serratia marcescens]